MNHKMFRQVFYLLTMTEEHKEKEFWGKMSTVRSIAETSVTFRREYFGNIHRALWNECRRMVEACQILVTRFHQILERHQSLPEEELLARWTEGKMTELSLEVHKVDMEKISLIDSYYRLASEFWSGSFEDLMVPERAYNKSYVHLIMMFQRVHMLMEAALGSCAA